MTQRRPNLLKTKYPELYTQLDKEKNAGIDLDKLSAGSHKKVWWTCEKGHSYLSTVYSRTSGRNCGICSKRVVVPGVNDLLTTHPDLLKSISPNNTIPPETVTSGSAKKLLWVCDNNHEWSAQVKNIVAGYWCPTCSGRVPITGVTDISTSDPDIVSKWWSPNNEVAPSSLSRGSDRECLWLCSSGHEYLMTVYRRISLGRGCPYCSGQKVLVGGTDLETVRPDIATWWSPENAKKPSEVTVSSNYAPKLECPKGHIIQMRLCEISYRVNLCARCAPNNKSATETQLYGLVHSVFPEAMQTHRVEAYLVDVFIPESVVIEYDGSYWHKDILSKDTNKTLDLLDKGYKVVRVREQSVGITLPHLPITHPNLFQISYHYNKNYRYLEECVREIVQWIGSTHLH